MPDAQLRMVALSSETQDDRIRKAEYRSSSSLLDFDVVLWEPERLLGEYPAYFRESTYRGLVCLDEDRSFDLVRTVERRRAEMESFLALGRTLIVVVPRAVRWYVDTGEQTTSGTGRNQKVTRHVREMTIEDCMPFPLRLTNAEGDEMELKLGEPFASFWRSQRERLYYSAVLQAHPGTVAATVNGTDKAVAVIAPVGTGTVILVPTIWWPEPRADESDDPDDGTLAPSERRAMDRELTDSLHQLAVELRAASGEYGMPEWAERLHLPGEAERQADVQKLANRLGKLQQQLDKQRADMKRFEERKILLAGSGVALEHVAAQALSALGFIVEPGAPGRTDRLLRLGEKLAVIEIKGKAKSAAERDAAQLEKWVATFLSDEEVQPKGILLVNAWRETPLDKRGSKAAFPKQMLPYSTTRGHCLITGVQLLCAWIDAEAHPERAREIAEGILNTVGEYREYADWAKYLTLQQTVVDE